VVLYEKLGVVIHVLVFYSLLML